MFPAWFPSLSFEPSQRSAPHVHSFLMRTVMYYLPQKGDEMDKNVYLYVCPNLADWEPALAIAMISNLNTDIPQKK
jgi:hypothetical protein